MEKADATDPAFNPLFTDFYQFTMSYAYWKHNKHNEPVVFEAFYRKNPFKGNYAIFAGLDEVISFLSSYRFTEAHMLYLKE